MPTAQTLPPAAAAWHDKRWLWLLSPTLPLLFTNVMLVYAWSGNAAWLLLSPFLMHALLPLLDRVLGQDLSNPPESAVAQLEQDFFYRVLVWAYIPFQYAGTFLGAWLVSTVPDMPWYALLGVAMAVGSINGIGIGTAHELGHKKEKLERWLAKIALAPSLYGHFYVEHNRGHHKRVATPEDPASARMGESFWAFFPRSVVGGLRSGWELERVRLGKQGKDVWNVDNHNLQAWALSLLLYAGLSLCLGWAVLAMLLLQAVYSVSLLEVVNYVEHYGLLRQKSAAGGYVRCEPEHSWNSNHVMGNIVLYHLQRHSDHHAHPARRYQALRHFEGAPQLPSGYGAMVFIAYFTPLWYLLMDARVVAHYGGDLNKINIQPSARQGIFDRWGADQKRRL